MNGSIEKAILNIISDPYKKENSFYGHILAQCYIQIDKTFEAVAGVGFWNDRFYLYINPNVFETFTLKEQKAILIHEAMHIIFNHFSRQKKRDIRAWNIATDAAVNQFLPDIPDDSIFPKSLGMPDGEYAEYYYQNSTTCITYQCLSSQKNDKCTRSGYGLDELQNNRRSIGSHKLWNESDTQNQEFIAQAVKNMIFEATEKSIGNIPATANIALKLLEGSSQISWNKILKRILGNNSKKYFEPSYKKFNRRFPNRVDLPGKKSLYIPTLVCIVDVSGSMSNKEILKGINEIQHICKLFNYKMMVLQIDTEVKDVSNTNFKNHTFVRSGGGGTDLYPAVQYLNEKKIKHDVIVFISDGYFSFDSWKTMPKVIMFFLITAMDAKLQLPTKRSYQFYLK